MSRAYEDFELMIQSGSDGFVVQLVNSPAGQASGHFQYPFTQVELSNFYGRIGQPRRSMRGADSPDTQAAKKFGDQLFKAVFTGDILSQLRTSMSLCDERNRGLRLRLRLKGAPALAEMPWEFLYDSEQNQFVATSSVTPVVRYLDLPFSLQPMRIRPPLRILVVLAGPRNLPCLDEEGEWKRLKSSLSALEEKGVLVLERMESATLEALRKRARGTPFHILHFVGHGGFDAAVGDGVLQFEDPTAMSNPVSGQFLGSILRDHASVRLAILNACEGGRQSNEDPFSGVAQSLCQQHLPAVVAMQFEISDDAAKTFAEEFYGALADGYPVDAAVSEARKALYTGRFGQEWATPVLYMRSPNGVLFDIQGSAKAKAAAVKLPEQPKVEAPKVVAVSAPVIVEPVKPMEPPPRIVEPPPPLPPPPAPKPPQINTAPVAPARRPWSPQPGRTGTALFASPPVLQPSAPAAPKRRHLGWWIVLGIIGFFIGSFVILVIVDIVRGAANSVNQTKAPQEQQQAVAPAPAAADDTTSQPAQKKESEAAAAPSTAAEDAAPQKTESAVTPGSLGAWIMEFEEASQGPSTDNILPYYAEVVSPYFGISRATWADIQKDKETYFERYPTIHYTVTGVSQQATLNNGDLVVDVAFDYVEVNKNGKTVRGRSYQQMNLRNVDGSVKIVAIQELTVR